MVLRGDGRGFEMSTHFIYLKISTKKVKPHKTYYMFSTGTHADKTRHVLISERMCSKQAKVNPCGGGTADWEGWLSMKL